MKTLRFIKNILIIVCLSFSILTSISKCKAYTFEQFEQFLQAVYDNNITSRAYSHYDAKYVLDNWYKIKNCITNNNVDISQYDSFGITANSTSVNNITEVSVVCFTKNSYMNPIPDTNHDGFIAYRGQGIRLLGTGFVYSFSDAWQPSSYDIRCGIFQRVVASGTELATLKSRCLTQFNWDPNDHPLIPPFSFTPYGILASGDWYYQKFSYTGNICLGELGNNEFYQLDIKLKNPNGLQLGVISIVPDVRHHRR